MDSFVTAWNLVSDYCKQKITDVAYKTWISKIKPVKLDFDNNIAVLSVPNEFYRQTLTKCYIGLLQEALNEIFDKTFEINFKLESELEPGQKSEKRLEHSFTFSNYIVGSSNKFAHAAALAVATNPAGAYNPLFIYGNSGLGKTHLLYAICNEVIKNDPKKVCLYIKGDDFTNELIESIRKNTTEQFHQKYREADVLLVDDIQFIAGKDSTQEEFFHTFNSLYEAQKQIVLTSDRPPKEIQTLEDRLRTRFEWGLIADIQPPDFETRIAIVRRKAELLGIKMPVDVSEYIAKKLKNNIRQLEGAVKKMKAHHLLSGAPLNIATAQDAISDILNNDQPPPITVEKIIEEVARTFGVSPDDIKSTRRNSNISLARQISMHIVREITQLPLVSIGEQFGGRDHSTIVYALKQVETTLADKPRTRAMVEDIIKNIRDR
ncbi:MAG: chromosomal replication initiator protein DnaA [Clostridia bacterium]|nr:chromosomal replication initiator protein DnaA [Clostridia bacterium]MBQ3092911.1 chromosomal replication initiator protein DnaA [Clostridia bacterium]